MKSDKFIPNQKIFTILVATVLTIVLFIHLITFQVRVTQMAVVTTFGEPKQAIREPGLYWKFPYPFQDYFTFDARIQIFSGKLEETYTADSKNVIIETYLGWRIDDPILFLGRAGTIKNAQKNIEAMLSNYMNSVLGKYNFENLVSSNPNHIKLSIIENDVKKLLNDGENTERGQMAGTKKSMGVVVEILGIQRLELPKATTKAVFDRMKEERNRVIQSFRAKGEGKAREIRAQADAKREETIISAQAEAKRIRGEGDAIASEHYVVFEKNRELALWLRKLDSLQKLLSENNKITLVIDTRTSPFDLLHEKFEITPKKPVENTTIPEKPVENTTTPEKPVENTTTPEKPVENTTIPEKPVESAKTPEKPVENTTTPEKPVENTTTPEKPNENEAPEENTQEATKSSEVTPPNESNKSETKDEEVKEEKEL